MRILLYQLIPVVVVLVPLAQVVGLAVYWRRSLASPWLFGLVGTVLAYAVTAGVVFVAESFEPRGGALITRGDGVSGSYTFELFAPAWFALLASVLLLCGVALWTLRLLFKK